MARKKHDLEERIEKALEDAPAIRGLTAKQVAQTTGAPYPTARWHLELMTARGTVDTTEVGRARLYALRKDKEKT